MEKIRKIPQRKCVGCGEHRDKGDFYRVVKSPDGSVSLDKTGRAAGRGAYVCKQAKCLRIAQKARRLDTALGISIPAEIYDALAEKIESSENNG